MLAARHYIQVELDRYPAFSQIQTADQVGNGSAIGQFERFTVQLNTHNGAVTTWEGRAF